jgi:alkyl hydroperoxide reductase subunit AhpC
MGRAVLAPEGFTPVCTTELGYLARLKPEFDKRNTKIIGLSVDPVDNHQRWSGDIQETQGFAPNYPMIGDTDLSIAKAWGMLPASTPGPPRDGPRPTTRPCATCSSSDPTRRSS